MNKIARNPYGAVCYGKLKCQLLIVTVEHNIFVFNMRNYFSNQFHFANYKIW